MSPRSILLPVLLCLSMIACGGTRAIDRSGPLGPLRLLGEARMPFGARAVGTHVGGLSGIDMASDGTWYLICDDRSERDPARFYSAAITIGSDSVDIRITGATTLLDTNGQDFARSTVDPEAIRFDPAAGTLWYTSEGDARAGIAPFVREMGLDGRFRREIALPAMFAAGAAHGVRNNGVFEGIALSADGRQVIVSTEDVLKQDGPNVSHREVGPVRISFYDRAAGGLVRQIAYVPEPAPRPISDSIATNNGVVEVLARDDRHLLVLERGFTPVTGVAVRLFEIDVAAATDVAEIDALAGATYRPATKRLVVDFGALGLRHVDNIEGIAWGPVIDGRRTLVAISDDNFSRAQVTQVIVLVEE